MDKDRLKGTAQQVKGSIKKALGRVTGDSKTEAEGTTEKTVGKGRSTFGSAKDTLRNVLKK